MELTPEQRHYLDQHGQLRSHRTSSDITAEQDADDAAALMSVYAGMAALMEDLSVKGVSERNLKHVRDRMVRRAGRELMEKIWEVPRRRFDGHPSLSNKFAYGGLWSPAAAQHIVDGVDYKNKLILEHVVPAKNVVAILAAHAVAGGDSLGGAAILSELVTHTVLTRADDAPLKRDLSPTNATALALHYTGQSRLSADELFETRWSRYLEADRQGLLPFAMSDLAPLTTSVDPSGGIAAHV